MAVLRTRRLATGEITGPAGDLPRPEAHAVNVYVCPPETRTILREIRLMAFTAVAGKFTVLYVDVVGKGPTHIVAVELSTHPEYFLQACDTVLEEGDAILLGTAETGPIKYYLSGAVLPILSSN